MNRTNINHPHQTHQNRVCQYCDFKCHYFVDLQEHIKEIHKPQKYKASRFRKCPHCDKHFLYTKDLSDHIKAEHDYNFGDLFVGKKVKHPGTLLKKGKPTFMMNGQTRCDNCGFIGQPRVMYRFHFDRCRYAKDSRIN